MTFFEKLLLELIFFGLFFLVFFRLKQKGRKSHRDGGGIRNVDYLSSGFDDDGR